MCPEDWISNGDYCYQLSVHPEQKLTWDAAQSACRAFEGADLVSIADIFEQSLLTTASRDTNAQKAGGYIWIGLNDKINEGKFSWSDGSKLTFQNWGFGKEQMNSRRNNCVRSSITVGSGDWSTALCNQKNYYACKKKRGESIDFILCNIYPTYFRKGGN